MHQFREPQREGLAAVHGGGLVGWLPCGPSKLAPASTRSCDDLSFSYASFVPSNAFASPPLSPSSVRYLEQVLDTGVGVPRHPLFFLGGNKKRGGKHRQRAARGCWPWRRGGADSSEEAVTVSWAGAGTLGCVCVGCVGQGIQVSRVRIAYLC